MIKVRATQDGTYGGYVWEGPKQLQDGSWTPGDIFEIEERPFAQRDEYGNPVQEMEPTGALDTNGNPTFRKVWVMDGGKPKKDEKGHPVPKIKMTTFFSPEWMERVSDDSDLSYPERIVPFPVLPLFRPVKPKAAKVVAVPADVAQAAGMNSKAAESPI